MGSDISSHKMYLHFALTILLLGHFSGLSGAEEHSLRLIFPHNRGKSYLSTLPDTPWIRSIFEIGSKYGKGIAWNACRNIRTVYYHSSDIDLLEEKSCNQSTTAVFSHSFIPSGYFMEFLVCGGREQWGLGPAFNKFTIYKDRRW